MKTKHKLKLLKELRENSEIDRSLYQEYKRILNELIVESKQPTQKPEIETKPEPITETFEVGEIVEVLENNTYTIEKGTKLQIEKKEGDFFVCNNLDMGYIAYLLPSEIKKIPVQKDNPKEFKVGDKVRVIDTSNHCFVIGKEVTVISEPSIFLWYIDCIDSCGVVQSLCINQIEHI